MEQDKGYRMGGDPSATEETSSMSKEEAAVKIQSRARGMNDRSKVEQDKGYRQQPAEAQAAATSSILEGMQSSLLDGLKSRTDTEVVPDLVCGEEARSSSFWEHHPLASPSSNGLNGASAMNSPLRLAPLDSTSAGLKQPQETQAEEKTKEEAAVKIQAHARGMNDRSKVEQDKGYRQQPAEAQAAATSSILEGMQSSLLDGLKSRTDTEAVPPKSSILEEMQGSLLDGLKSRIETEPVPSKLSPTIDCTPVIQDKAMGVGGELSPRVVVA